MLKKVALCAITTVAFASLSFAGVTSSGKDYKNYKEPAPVTCFDDTEFQLDVFGSYNWVQEYSDGFGGGLGFNAFFARYVGVGISGDLIDGGVDGLWDVSGSLILRLPIDSICLAPYVLGGGGVEMNGSLGGTLHAGGGLEYRFIRHSLAFFAEGRYIWGFDQSNQTQVRSGLRVIF
jgi:hypothetical protein